MMYRLPVSMITAWWRLTLASSRTISLSGGDVSLAVEPISEVLIRRERCGEDLDRVESRQSGVLSQINLAHPAGTEPAQNSIPGEDFSVG